MRPVSKYVSPLKEKEIGILEELMKHDPNRQVRMRAHSILLSSRGSSISEIVKIYQVHRVTVSTWIDSWEEKGVEGLRDKKRTGAPSKLTKSEKTIAKKLLKKFPQSPKTVLAKLSEQIGKQISASTLKRIAKSSKLRWKRVRKSSKSQRKKNSLNKQKRKLKS